MSLAATLASDGMRPASFLPTIKCSSCGNEIEISAMGDHECTQASEASSRAGHETLSSPYALRPMNPNGFQPAQPSPLQFDSPSLSPPPPSMQTPEPPSTSASPPPFVAMPKHTPPPPGGPQTRQRAPTVGSGPPPSQRMPRPAPPRINADMANKPFLAPHPQGELPISPAASAHSASSMSNKRPPPQRSMTSPMPRLWDIRPPSPELSANLDCAFPPFPMFNETRSRRPSASSGRKTPNGSERGPSRSGSRQGHKFNDLTSMEPRSPVTMSGSVEPTNRRPSNDDRNQESSYLDRSRPTSPESLRDELPPLPPLSKIEPFQAQQPHSADSNSFDFKSSSPPPDFSSEKKVPPARPARPTESLTPSLLDTLRTEPVSSISAFPMPPLPSNPMRNHTFPLRPDSNDSSDAGAPLSKMRSEPSLRDAEDRPTLPEINQSESQIPPSLFPARGQSKNEARVDYRLHDAPPVPKPVQVHRSGSMHKPSGSNSSSASSTNSLRMTNSSAASPVTSAASSVDVFSPIAQEVGRSSEENGLRVAGLNVNKNQIKPGMRAEQPKEKSPPRNFARPAPPKEFPVSPAVEEPPAVPAIGSWPLESPMDPAMKNGRLGDDGPPSSPENSSLAPPSQLGMELNPNLSPAAFSADEFDPYRALTPMANPEPPSRPSNDSDSSYFQAYSPDASPRSQTPKPSRSPPHHGRQRSRTTESSVRPFQPPPIPQEPLQTGLQRRPTVGGKSPCRGCGLLIEGKSIKAADGNLTGRWHKQCFVCKTCEQPFNSHEFYVINNQPYCEQHYHEKNQSLCFGCRKGIEGQYVETRSQDHRGLVMRKYHPRCFMCVTCRKPLTDDYFDIQGRVYCETHAMASQRIMPRRTGPGGSMVNRSGGPGLSPHGNSGLRAERRTTKMGMIGGPPPRGPPSRRP